MEENNNNNNNQSTVNLGISLFFIGLLIIFGVAIGLGLKNDDSTSNKAKETESSEKQEDKKEPVKEIPKEEEEKEPEILIGKIKSTGEISKKDIVLNGKKNTLALFDGSSKSQKSYITFGKTDLDKVTHFGTGGPEKGYEMPEITYAVVNGTDNKQYLVVYYDNDFNHILLVLNEDTNIIWEYKNLVKSEGFNCFATFNKGDETLFTIIKGEVYYFRYPDDKVAPDDVKQENNSIDLIQVKLEIGNDKVTEVKTDNKKAGKFYTCG